MSTKSYQLAEALQRASQDWAHRSDLVIYARKVLGDGYDSAEDIVQEAYLRLLALAASDDAPSSARPWLFRVVRNLAIDERRSAARRAVPVAEMDVVAASTADDTALIVERNSEVAGALAGVAALPPRERRAIEMDQAGITAQRIAEALDTTPNAVHQALFRARRRLRNARAVAWSLIPVGAIPLALRMSDPSIAASVGNLPPGLPIGRALPVVGLVAAAVVGGTVVVPAIEPTGEPAVVGPASIGATNVGVTPAATTGFAGTNRGSGPSGGFTVVIAPAKDADSEATDDDTDRFDATGRDPDEDRGDDSSGKSGEDDDSVDERKGRDDDNERDESDDDSRSGKSGTETRNTKSGRSTTKESSGKRSGVAKKAKVRVTPSRDADDDRRNSSSGSGSGDDGKSDSGDDAEDSD